MKAANDEDNTAENISELAEHNGIVGTGEHISGITANKCTSLAQPTMDGPQ